MGLIYDEIELTESAYRHGYDDEDVVAMLRQRHLVIQNRRGRMIGFEILGRSDSGEYLLAAARVVESYGFKVLRVFHLNRMSDTERKRFQRSTGSR